MTKKEKALLIARILDHYFPNPSIPLHHKDPYTLLIAVLLSAQCTDMAVNKATPDLFSKADNPYKMAELPIEEIQKPIRFLGLSQRKAEAISKLSKILIEKHRGMVPDNFTDLEELPGVGHKTASVVMAQAFGHDAFPVDTHIHRCANRWGLTSAKTVEQTEEALKKLFPPSSWRKVHLQIIYFARQFCPARGHIVEDCPICKALAVENKRTGKQDK